MSALALRLAGGVPGGRSRQRDAVIARATDLVGVHGSGGADGRSGDLTPFGRQFGEDGVPWSQVFVRCVFADLRLDHLLYGKFDRPAAALAAFRAQGRTSWYPALGAQVLLGTAGAEHTGIVIGFDATTVTTVEGDRGDRVQRLTRQRTDPYVYAYGYPEYAEGTVSADPGLTAPAPDTPQSGPIGPRSVLFDPYTGGGGVDAWIRAACQAAGLPFTEAWRSGYRTLCARESSGDPNAVNTTDANAVDPPGYRTASDGHPFQCSRGVAQCIPQTFAAHHCPGSSLDIYHPVANIAASIRYVRAAYGVAADGSDLAARVQQADPSRPPAGY
ncbi:hypothetical protein [Kitasatospora sp. NPDC094015]|uniref:hypothetical protein n=1 Tax=Kitasatospora sp. NPDC094015 TaxID=3155205 RepID=UPI0033211C4F